MALFQTRAPHEAVFAGYAGLIALVLAAIAAWAGWREEGATYLMFAVAAIVSFLGGVRWGLALRSDAHGGTYLWSILPAAASIGMLALLWNGFSNAAFGLALVALITLYFIDRGAPGLMPDWYRSLRLRLTLGAVLALAAGFSALHLAP